MAYLIPAKTIYERPSYFCTVELSLAGGNGMIGLSGGMGLPEGFISLPETEDEVTTFVESMDVARVTEVPVWRGLDIRHLYKQEFQARVPGERIVALDVLAAYDAGSKWLTQEAFDFLTCRDLGLIIGAKLVGEQVADLFHYDMEHLNLMSAFARQMINEAEPTRHKVASGIYVMQREPLPAVDHELIYDTLRLFVTPHGIFCTIISESDCYTPFFWTPTGINTSQMFVHVRGIFALEVMLSCIWRDACVVKEGFAVQRKGSKGYEAKTKAAKPTHKNPVILPRTIYKSTWGAAEDREIMEHAARQAHTVKAHYRELHEGWNVSKSAYEKAEEYNFPPPPEGWTFVVPHIRGMEEGDAAPTPTVRRVVCKGLQVARIALGK